MILEQKQYIYDHYICTLYCVGQLSQKCGLQKIALCYFSKHSRAHMCDYGAFLLLDTFKLVASSALPQSALAPSTSVCGCWRQLGKSTMLRFYTGPSLGPLKHRDKLKEAGYYLALLHYWKNTVISYIALYTSLCITH